MVRNYYKPESLRRHHTNGYRLGVIRQILLTLLTLLALPVAVLFAGNLSAGVALAAAESTPAEADLSRLEQRFFAHDYIDQSMDARLERLEKLIFGEAKAGTDGQRLKEVLSTMPKDDSPGEGKDSGAASESKTGGAADQKPTSHRLEPPASQSAGNNSASPASSKYPTVSKLERIILGQSYPDDPVRRRLGRLEATAFGNASQSDDMTERVDRLINYAGLQSDWAGDDFLPPYLASRWPASQATSAGTGLLQKVRQVEDEVFGRTCVQKPLIERVHNLEKVMFPAEQNPGELSLPERVERIHLAIGTERRLTSSYPSIAQNAPNPVGGAGGLYSSPAGTASPAAASSPRGRHPFLRGLGKALGVAGQLAVGALGSIGGGYYSMPLGGSFGSGFGGFGMSPFGFGGPLSIGGIYY